MLISFLKKHWILWVLLITVLILRIPNLFEPYWYGDEGIYLTLGIALKQGKLLYAEIIDHKTPLIYYLAMVPDQFWFRVLNIGWMVATTTLWYGLAQKLFQKHQLSIMISGLLFVALTTLPWFEGHIPNGELFVMGFVLAGTWLFSQTQLFTAALETNLPAKKTLLTGPDLVKLFLSGCLFGLGILTKVPGLFEMAGTLTLLWFFLTNTWTMHPKKMASWQKLALQIIIAGVTVVAGAVVMIALSILYYWSKGTFQAYLDYGLLYNFRYAGSWGLPFTNPALLWAFTLPGKILIGGTIVIILTLARKHLTPTHQWLMAWLVLSLIAGTLSNRPYPHYYVQTIPALSLLFGSILATYFTKPNKNWPVLPGLFGTGLVGLWLAVLALLNFGLYATGEYYAKFAKLVTGQISAEEYRNSFDSLMADNYTLAPIIMEAQSPELFIWGTNPMLYAQTHTSPPGRFTVSFHIADFDAYDETLADVQAANLPYIVVMNDHADNWPEFNDYLFANYTLDQELDRMSLWQRNTF